MKYLIAIAVLILFESKNCYPQYKIDSLCFTIGSSKIVYDYIIVDSKITYTPIKIIRVNGVISSIERDTHAIAHLLPYDFWNSRNWVEDKRRYGLKETINLDSIFFKNTIGTRW